MTTNNRPLLDAEEFGDVVEERIEQLQGIEDIERLGFELRFRIYGRDVISELDHFYRAYQRTPEQLESILQTIEGAIRSFAPDRGQNLWDELEDRVYPMLKPVEMLTEVAERELPQLVYQPFFADLIICYVIDEQESVAFINKEHLETWGILESTLHNRAIDNLRVRTTKPDVLKITGQGDQTLFIYSNNDGLDAARIFLVDLIEEWQQHIPGRLVIGIPNRDFLIGFSDANPEILHRIALKIAHDASSMDYGLTDQLFTIVNQHIELYEYDWSSSERNN